MKNAADNGRHVGNHTRSTPQLPRLTKISYGAGAAAFGVKDQGFTALVLIFYNQVIGLPAQTVGIIIFLALIVDAILDPIVGQMSDNWKSRWGRRHPFMYAAALPAAASYIMMWHPPEVSQTLVAIYLFFAAVIVRSFITIYEIPSSALAPELTADYDERTKVFAFRQFFGWIAGVSMTILAFRFFLQPSAEQPIGQLNREGYSTYALVAAAIIFLSIMVSALGTHKYIPRLHKAPATTRPKRDFLRQLIEAFSHKAFLVLAIAALFNAMAQGLVLSMQVYVSTYLFQLSSQQIGMIAASSLISALLALNLAPVLARRFGKMNAARFSKLTALLFVLIPVLLVLTGGISSVNDTTNFLRIFFFCSTMASLGTIICAILVNSMVADVVEDFERRSGKRTEGTFFAIDRPPPSGPLGLLVH
ncbi:MAG: MFS transporter [Sphingopyxis sp.]|uniref:MFS transporter n=1 Tax=Sphingopyxis sp. TaxID=1908224 RepID=UPI002ABC8A49|nr:MFS transporter [Sphingopyxis sp.]MDZ3833121.1 MFS transporter [Sphingopyxis sp.]